MTWTMRYRTNSVFQSTVKPCWWQSFQLFKTSWKKHANPLTMETAPLHLKATSQLSIYLSWRMSSKTWSHCFTHSFVAQDVVQTFHWNNSQATLHPYVVYYKSKGELKHLNLCVISDCLKHDSLVAHAFINKGMPYIKEQLPFVTKLHYFSDGCGGQYKTIRICTMSVSTSKTLELKQSGIS